MLGVDYHVQGLKIAIPEAPSRPVSTRRTEGRVALELNHTFASLFQEISESLDSESRHRIRELLECVDDDADTQRTKSSLTPPGKRKRRQEEVWGTTGHYEAHLNSSIEPQEGPDILVEDVMRNLGSRETGYFGQASEIQWLRTVQRRLQHIKAENCAPRNGLCSSLRDTNRARLDASHKTEHSKQTSTESLGNYITDASFYLDGSHIATDTFIDPYEMPDRSTAEKLFGCYMETVHSSFPLVPASFEVQFRGHMIFVKDNQAWNICGRWLAQLNLVFAIGAKYSHLIGAEWRGDERDHIQYMARAVQLMGSRSPVRSFTEPDLELIQANSSLSFYFLVTGNVSRAWATIGISLRHATALGLHLRNEDFAVHESNIGAPVSIWWVARSIECLLNTVTGRPPIISDEYCAESLPESLPNKNHNSEQSGKERLAKRRYFISRTKASILTRKAQRYLYSPHTAAQSWELIQARISDLLDELESWDEAALLPYPEAKHEDLEGISPREWFVFNTEYWSLKILLTQPYLIRLGGSTQNQGNTLTEFDTKTAEACVTAALAIVKILPEHPNHGDIYSEGPWWAILHIVMQSMTVLLLDVTHSVHNMHKENVSTIPAIKKLIRVLRAMQKNDPLAARAYAVVRKTLESASPTYHPKIHELTAWDRDDVSQPHTLQHFENALAEQPLWDWQDKVFSSVSDRSPGSDPSHQWLFDSFPTYQPPTPQSSQGNPNTTSLFDIGYCPN
ncbi:hypothetical protein OPT61_g7693 [Boeremia exigua]|uniref:Uncharacterized protein n=1 Tax=Boeremia exigua TaxID=749465 RepID=A0ACC2I181_9PLEO|nr:hypothetical protein OPT61_g7693 [Boeremia exigua]